MGLESRTGAERPASLSRAVHEQGQGMDGHGCRMRGMRETPMTETKTTERAEGALEQPDRRKFLVTASLTGGALLLKGAFQPAESFASAASDVEKTTSLNAWVRIGTDDAVTIVVSQAEMGQGIRTTLPAIIAE